MALHSLVHGERVNATIAWAAIVVVALGAVGSFATDEVLWGVLALLVAAVATSPAVATRDAHAMVPWPLPLVAASAVITRVFGFYPETTGYVAVTSLALLVVVELDVFTRVELSRRFAIVFAVLTTMAIQALWTIAQFYSDRWLGTEFLRSQTELQWDLVVVTVVGVVMGALAEWYFERFEPVGSFERPPSR